MANTIKIRRGLKSDLPTLAQGEMAFCTDTNELYIGTDSGNLKLAPASGSGLTKAAGGAITQVLARPSNSYYTPLGVPTCYGLTTLALVANQLEVVPFSFDEPATFSRIAVQVTTEASDKYLSFGIYDSTLIGYEKKPNSLIYDVTDIDASTTGIKEVQGSFSFEANKTYFAAVISDGTPILRAASAGGQPPTWVYLSGTTATIYNHLYMTIGSYQLPSSLTSYTIYPSANPAPVFFVR